jgi:hypothetical protein
MICSVGMVVAGYIITFEPPPRGTSIEIRQRQLEERCFSTCKYSKCVGPCMHPFLKNLCRKTNGL